MEAQAPGLGLLESRSYFHWDYSARWGRFLLSRTESKTYVGKK
jgi:hypothetical protein